MSVPLSISVLNVVTPSDNVLLPSNALFEPVFNCPIPLFTFLEFLLKELKPVVNSVLPDLALLNPCFNSLLHKFPSLNLKQYLRFPKI